MRVRAAPVVTAVLAALATAPPGAGAAGWDSTPLLLSPLSDHPPTLAPIVETTDDGASWVMWAEDPDSSGLSDVVVRRIDANGIAGELRVLTSTSPQFNGSIALAPLPDGDVRVAYISDSGATLQERRLTPTSTGDPVVLYDKATTDDGDVTDNGNVSGGTVRALAAPSGASWVAFVRMNNGSPLASARRVADDDGVGTLAALTQPHYEPSAAVDPSGRLIIAVASGAQARGVVQAIETNGTVGSEVEIRPSVGSSAILETPTIGIDAAGVATVGWVFNMSGRSLQARRVDTTSDPMTPLGTGPVTLNDDVPVSYYQYAPLFGVDPGGDVLLGWYETDSSQDNTNAMARVLGDGAFADAGVIGPRLQLDGPSPEGAWVTAVVPGPAGVATAFSWTTARVCRASRVDLATKAVLGTDVIPGTGCAAPVGPASGATGTVATWTEYPSWQVALSRYVTAAPACSDGVAATVEAGKSVTLALPCTGWRPGREVTGAPARGTLGAIDQDAGTVTYNAGADAGADTVRFRAANGAGPSAERSVAITVTPAPVTPGGPNPPPPDTTDRTPPVLTGLALKPKRLSLRKLRAPVLSFSLSEPATVNAAVQRLVKGRRKGGRCITKPLPPRGARCVKAKTVKRLSVALPAGPARLKIRLRRPLSPGRHRVTISATDQSGNISKTLRASLTIARR
jgi:hypothetical protein